MSILNRCDDLKKISIERFINVNEPTLSIYLTIREATLVMEKFGLKHMLAIDHENKIYGVITHTTIFRCVAYDDKCLERLVVDYLDREPLYVDRSESVYDTLMKMISRNKDYALVVKNSTIIGIVRLLDLLKNVFEKELKEIHRFKGRN